MATTPLNQSFPYTVRHLAELLGLDESAVLSVAAQLGLSAHHDTETETRFFPSREAEAIRQAAIAQQNGMGGLSPFASRPANQQAGGLAIQQPQQARPAAAASFAQQLQATQQQQAEQPHHHPQQQAAPQLYRQPAPQQATPAGQPQQMSNPMLAQAQAGMTLAPDRPTGTEDKASALILKTMSQTRGMMLKELAEMLDEKLAGIDEVVIELIRTKTELDTLKQKHKAMTAECESLRYELDAYKPVGMGFYRKTS